MSREAVCSFYYYPDFKSRLKTYFLKLFRLYDGEVWDKVATFKIGEDENWIYVIEVMQADWCKQKECLLIRVWKLT